MSTKAAAVAALSAHKSSNKVSKNNSIMSKVNKVTKHSEGPQVSSKTHKRSRDGCHICRLRRKKCDETKPGCRACKHLGLTCEYKRPSWWNDSNLRKAQKELIKTIIKKTKTTEKQQSKEAAAAAAIHTLGAHTPPGLSRSVPTSATSPGSINGRTRAVSEDSQYSDYEAQFYNGVHDPYHTQIVSQYAYTHDPSEAHYYGYPAYPSAPYEVDIKTERQTYINDVPTRRDSSISSFSTYQPPHTSLPPLLEQPEWMPEPEEMYQGGEDLFSDYTAPTQEYMEYPQIPESTTETTINFDLDECDKHLLQHFFEHVLPLIYPVKDVNANGSTISKMIIPALKSNKTYLSICLSAAASHLKSITENPSEQLDSDIVRHRFAAIKLLCDTLAIDEDHDKILEATLAMITLPTTVCRPGDCLPDIPWHKHFDAADSLIQRLGLKHDLLAAHPSNPHVQPPFNMTVAAWIDILGASVHGQAPRYADVYRDKLVANSMSGLTELMGCDDRIMYLISEISCLAGLQRNGRMSDEQLCLHITTLGNSIDIHETHLAGTYDDVITETGAIRPRVLQRNITLLFSKAARIYLLSLIPGTTRHDPTMRNLLSEFTLLLEQIPSGPGGFDRSIAWPLLVAGSQSTRDSTFRAALAERVTFLGQPGKIGSFACAVELLHEVWNNNDLIDATVEATSGVSGSSSQHSQMPQHQDVHWRDVMLAKGWDFLLL